eukprot:115788_1
MALICLVGLLQLTTAHIISVTNDGQTISTSKLIYDIISTCSASGNGITDDTIAVQNCSDQASKTGGVLYFPPSSYLITSTITITANINTSSTPPLTIMGFGGLSSVILWSSNTDLFIFTHYQKELHISNLKIQSIKVNKSTNCAAFRFNNGLLMSQFINVFITNDEYKPFAVSKIYKNRNIKFEPTINVGSGIIINGETSSVIFRDVVIWELIGVGIQISYGAEVRILGGQIYGIQNRKGNSIAIHVIGNNGGVHIENADINSVGIGLLLNNINGAGSNREVFIEQATFDSSGIGIYVNDTSYVNIVGLWAASSDYHQIYVAPTQDKSNPYQAVVVISGGTIFNGGVYGDNLNCNEACNGLTVNSGTFILNGLIIRQNKGKAIWIENEDVKEYVINGCYFFDNNINWILNNQSKNIVNNICYPHKTNSRDSQNNVNCPVVNP